MEYTTVIIETPKGSKFKYDFVPEENHFKLKKILPLGLIFPFDFGFIPNTIGGDNDPLDVIIISEFKLFTGCSVDCRIIGTMKVEQEETNRKVIRNDRLIAIPVISKLYNKVQKIVDFPTTIIKELEQFFINYNKQEGKVFKVIEYLSAKKTKQLILSATHKISNKKVELFIPLINQQNNTSIHKKYNQLRIQLLSKFGGLTIYKRTPVEGLWNDENEKTVQDDIMIYEIMIQQVDLNYWKDLKRSLEKSLNQEEIIIRISDAVLI